MSQVGSPPAAVRPAAGTPPVTGGGVTPAPTDQAAGNAPRHDGSGGQPAPQQQPAPQTPAPPAPAVTLSGALTALFAGQPVTAAVTTNADGQVVLRLPEAQLVLDAKATQAARGEVLVLKLAASTPNPTILIVSRNGRPVADPAPLPVTIEPVPEPPTAIVAAARRPLPLPTPPPLSPPQAPLQSALLPAAPQTPSPLPAASVPVTSPPVIAPAVTPVAAPAPHQRVVVAAAPATGPATAFPTAPATIPAPVAPPLAAAATVVTTAPPLTPVSRTSPPLQAPAPTPAPFPVAAEDELLATERPPAAAAPRAARPAPIAPPPFAPGDISVARQATSRPVPFVPPELPPEAPRPHLPPLLDRATGVARAATPSVPPSGGAAVGPTLRSDAVPAQPDPANRPAVAAAPAERHLTERSAVASTPAARAVPAPAAPGSGTGAAALPPIEIEPLPPPDAPIDRRAASAWSALWAVARTDPLVAEHLREMLQPRVSGRLGGGLAFLVAALRGGRLSDWIGGENSSRIDLPSRPDGRHTVEAEFRDLARMAQERGPDGWRAQPLAVLDGGAIQPVMLYIHRPPRRRKTDPNPDDASQRFMLDLKLSRAGPMRIDGLLRPKVLDVIIRTERAVPSRIQRELRQVFATTLEGAGLGGSLGFQKVEHLPPAPPFAADGKPHHAVLA